MKVIRKPNGWWIVDTPEGVDDMGPYETKTEADEDRRGVQRFLANPAGVASFGMPECR